MDENILKHRSVVSPQLGSYCYVLSRVSELSEWLFFVMDDAKNQCTRMFHFPLVFFQVPLKAAKLNIYPSEEKRHCGEKGGKKKVLKLHFCSKWF